MGSYKYKTSTGPSNFNVASLGFSNKVDTQSVEDAGATNRAVETNVDIDLKEVYLLIMHFLSAGPCQRAFGLLQDELVEHKLLPRRFHAWFSRSGACSGYNDDDGISFPISYNSLMERYPHIGKDHLVKLLKQLMLGTTSQLQNQVGGRSPNAVDVPTILGSGSFSLLDFEKNMQDNQVKPLPLYLRWPHIKADQVRGLGLREIGGGFRKHHRTPSIRAACYAIAKPLTMVQKMQNIKRLRGHLNAVYCAIFDRSGRYVITGSDDRLVKIWSMETAFCLASCRGHEGDITDLAVSSNNALVASASNDFVIRVWRLPDGMPISVLQGHTGAVTTIAFSPKPNAVYQLLSSSDDGTCRIWDARYSQCNPRIYLPKPCDATIGKNSASNFTSSSNGPPNCQILCCSYNANGTVFVTGSSDTFARVWGAPKSNPDGLEEPIHEMDLLSGHENDVNYVQFSGCSVASKFSTTDASKEENFPKFKNSWFCHDNIVTCSRDGSAIIWVPRSRRSHGKTGHWIRAYHLKVPPPPLPPQPPLGRSRQRFLPTPRGVNMIIWSLDNRFVLAAIMDCRICVWNAVDGSLVHSLTGHTASSYVLDVHPFNPRIAMSAGYDGQTIVWDIWEGVPIRRYEIGRFKLVDGKFSPDGTSIVLSDEVGQIYLLNTGQGESQKDAKYDQFFLGDYRPLIRDTQGNVLDQETQLTPHRRNIQDPLCDASMVPYPEPYQSQFQQRRLGALGIEWHPSSIKYAVGPVVSVEVETQMLPFADLERMIEPQPEFIDAMYWEPENEVFSDAADSEYNVTEENPSGGERGSFSGSSSTDSECSEEDSDAEYNHKDSLRRSRRKRLSSEVGSMYSSGRHVKRRTLAECHGLESRSDGRRRAICGRKALKRKSSKAKASRPRRIAARNARKVLSKYTGTSTNEDEDDSGYESSDSLQGTKEQIESETELLNIPLEQEQSSLEEWTNLSNHPVNFKPAANSVNKRLVIKFSVRDSKKHTPPGHTSLACDRQIDMESQSSRSQQTTDQNIIAISSMEQSSIADIAELELNQDYSRNGLRDGRQLIDSRSRVETLDDKDMVHLEEASIRLNASHINGVENNSSGEPEIVVKDHALDVAKYMEIASPGSSLACNEVHGSNHDRGEKHPLKFTIKKKGYSETQFKIKLGTAPKESTDSIGDVNTQNASSIGPSQALKVLGVDETVGRSNHSQLPHPYWDIQNSIKCHQRDKSIVQELKPDSFGYNMDARTSDLQDDQYLGIDAHRADDKLITRARSIRKAASEMVNPAEVRSRAQRGKKPVGTSKFTESYSEVSDHHSRRSKSSKKQPDWHLDQTYCISKQGGSTDVARKPSWLMLLKQEKDYRYIPQLGDKVVYLRQGHQEFLESTVSSSGDPCRSIVVLSSVEVCKVEELNYATVPGSGESCCKIKLRIVDPLSSAHGALIEVTLLDLPNFSDFVVEKTRYDAAIQINWEKSDKCQVWWRDESNDGGKWWAGEIVSSQAKSQEFPDSPWERYLVHYEESQDLQLHSPWELHHPEISWQNLHIDRVIKEMLLCYFNKLEHSTSRYQDKYGIQALNQVADKSEFRNRFPVPLYPELIRARLQNDYYRSLEAVGHDIREMLSNARNFFTRNDRLLRKIDRLSNWLTKKLKKVESHSP